MILVTGATGNIGQAVAAGLAEKGVPFRVGVRRPASWTGGGEAVAFDFLDPATYRAAVAGCRALFLLRPPAIANTRDTLNRFVDVARGEGVAQVVFVSVAGAGSNPIVPHHAVETHLQQEGGGWTILRPGFFAQNLGDAYRDDIRQDNRLYVPAGQGRAAFVDVRDVAEVAVEALVHPDSHRGQTYTLTGPEARSFADAARILTDVLGRPIGYVPASIPGYVLHLLRRRGLPLAQALVQTVLHVGLRFGQAEAVDPTLARLLGHPPRTLRDYARDHAALWG